MPFSRQPLRLLFAIALVPLGACFGFRESQTARARAASDLSCPESEISLQSVPGNGYVASGCQRSEQLTCMTTTNKEPIFKTTSSEVSCVTNDVHDDTPAPIIAVVSSKENSVEGDDGAKEHAAFLTTMRTVLQSIPYRDCGAAGLGRIELTVTPAGTTSGVTVVEGEFDDATTSCITERFGHVHIAPFAGAARTFRWKIDLGA